MSKHKGIKRTGRLGCVRVQSDNVPKKALNLIRPFAEDDGRGDLDSACVRLAVITMAKMIEAGTLPKKGA